MCFCSFNIAMRRHASCAKFEVGLNRYAVGKPNFSCWGIERTNDPQISPSFLNELLCEIMERLLAANPIFVKELSVTPLRQRMTEDMQVRNLSPHTRACYVQQVSLFARHFNQSPETLGPEQIRAYQVYLTNEKKLGPYASSTRSPCIRIGP
jgi:Phage integrase, N-terminal SAM-like domain